ncbi:F-box protein [Rhynchospora pubera]|uniref:F-box protein n=1 Tax=Rhynchospora pubera TaxID=906938 RepID=A0AAV8FJA8_9POAL|nr:F-box protein [Rhynchospora pubera]
MAESLLVSNSDILFMILSLLPAEALLRVKSVCRAWAEVISDPAFVRAHSSRPTPITYFFAMMLDLGENQIQGFKRFEQGAKFPTSIGGILSSGFKAVSSSHGLLCFRRDWVFIVGNPAISHWCVLQFPTPNSLFMFHGAVLMYDPVISTHFKLAVVLITLDNREALKHYIQFNIYTSETSSWTVSSLFTQFFNPEIVSYYHYNIETIRGSDVYKPCKIGGGSICWIDEFESLVGYEISTDTYWKASMPPRIGKGVAKVWRLEGKNSWVLEGEGDYEQLRLFVPTQFAYDPARRALILGVRDNGEYFALHLSTSRLEIVSHAPDFQPPPWEMYDHPIKPHANTLAPLHGAETGLNGLARGFRRLGLRPLDL